MSLDEDIENIKNTLKEASDVETALLELFKDSITHSEKNGRDFTKSDVDLRTRLNHRNVKGLSVVSFFENVFIDEIKKDKISLADGLDILGLSFKRHLVSKTGSSRQEVVNLFQGSKELEKPQNKFNMFTPQGAG